MVPDDTTCRKARQPRQFPSPGARRRWIVAASRKGRTGPEIARALGLSRSRVCSILKTEQERRQQADERKRGRLAAQDDPASLPIQYLELPAYSKNPLLAHYGRDVTLGELAQEPNLIAVVNGFGPMGAGELAAIMKAYGIR